MKKPIRWGATLAELLLVVAIIGMLVSLMLPAVQSARESSRATLCRSNIRQLVISIEQYHSANGTYPPSRFDAAKHVGPDGNGWSWMAKVLPFLEEDVDIDVGSKLSKSAVLSRTIPTLICPSDGFAGSGPRTDAEQLRGIQVGQTSLKAVSGSNWGADITINDPTIQTLYRNQGANGSFDGYSDGDGIMFRNDWKKKMHHGRITDGLSKTFLIGEDLPVYNTWCSWPYVTHPYGTCAIPPNTIARHPSWWPDTVSFRSSHPNGLHFGLADGSVRWISNSIERELYWAYSTRSGQETLRAP